MQKAPYFVGLDIGTSSVRCVIGMMEHTDLETKISVIGVGTAVNTGMRKGTVIHLDEVSTSIAESIAEAERMAGVRVAGRNNSSICQKL
jgi:cell division protein FtsA